MPIAGLEYKLGATLPTSEATELRAEAQARAREAAALRAERAAATAAAAAAMPTPPPAITPPAPQTVQEIAVGPTIMPSVAPPAPVITPAIAPPAPQTVQEMSVAPPIWTSVIPPGTTPIVKPTTTIKPLIAPKPVTKPQTATTTTYARPRPTKPVTPDLVGQFLNFIQNLFNKKSLGYKTNRWDGLGRGKHPGRGAYESGIHSQRPDGTISELERGR